MKTSIFLFYLWLLKAGLWKVLLYRRYRRLPQSLIFILSKLGFNPENKFITLFLEGCEHQIWARYQSTDLDVFYQIFIEEEYACLENSNKSKLIIDCGANVGYSSIYLLNKYPNAHVIAVEPDEENFKVCQKNLSPYSDRVTVIRSAVWSRSVGLIFSENTYDNGYEWAIQVRECPEDRQPDLLAIDLLSLLEKSGFTNIDLLKIDVEGSEVAIFSNNYQTWLDRVKNLVIELHGEKCEQTFFKALSEYKYNLSKSGELTVCQNILSKSAPI
jgi:FkbM family methyltransferase